MSLLPALDGILPDTADAVVVDGVPVSWEQLAGRADTLAARLAGAPAAALCGTSTLDTVIGVVAGLRAGVPVVPVPADAGPMEREHILRDSGAALMIGDPDWPEVDLERIPVPTVGVPTTWSDVSDESPALIMYTSGTTGLPKG
ncbi:MAG: hypothetical protein RLZZ01_25, partial [Actinomycetota bacterium]